MCRIFTDSDVSSFMSFIHYTCYNIICVIVVLCTKINSELSLILFRISICLSGFVSLVTFPHSWLSTCKDYLITNKTAIVIVSFFFYSSKCFFPRQSSAGHSYARKASSSGSLRLSPPKVGVSEMLSYSLAWAACTVYDIFNYRVTF